jgi:hypothetical protein
MAARAIYVPSPKHKRGMFINEYGTRVTGKPGLNATTVEEAVEEEPDPPFTMVCPSRWNDRHPRREATDLLRQAIRNGQIGHPVTDGMPQWVWARDPEDLKVVYLARRLSPSSDSYKAYPLTESQVLLVSIEIR